MRDLLDAARIDLSLDCRSVSFENPTGARGAGGSACGGRKGAPLPAGAEDAMRAFLAAHPQHEHGVHAYALADFGLSEADVERAFSAYRERYAVGLE